MQLFSIGLYKLNMDGSQVLDEDGSPVETYTIDDIMSYASAWTGFEQRKARGGAASANRHVDKPPSRVAHLEGLDTVGRLLDMLHTT